MLPNSNKIKCLTGDLDLLEKISKIPAYPMWSQRVILFLSALSRELMKDSRSREYQDIMSYAFWIRKASLEHIHEVYYPNSDRKVGRGVALHIAPSNVPINFAVSFTSALLAGNANIVRVSNKEFAQVDIIVDALNVLFDGEFSDMKPYLLLIRYEHDEEITEYLSDICDIRLIWGGNQTISLIRQAALPPRAIEMAFADRHSLAIINGDAVLKGNPKQLIEDFYVDTYYSDQNACSSPRMVIWVGENIAKAQEIFWTALHEKVVAAYDMKPVQTIDKLNMFYKLAAVNKHVHLLSGGDTRVTRIGVDLLTSDLMDYKLGGGYFFEYCAEDLRELEPILGKSCQTIAYYGLDGEEIRQDVISLGVRGVDRIVPVGKSMDLTFKWDGYDMIETMSRYIYAPEYKDLK